MNRESIRSRSQAIVFLGPPGSGKGTQSVRLSAELGIPAISTGEMLRQEYRSGSKLGLAVNKILLSGQLVSDDLMNDVVASRLAKPDCEEGCILDGYPRTLAQGLFLDSFLERAGRSFPTVFDFLIPSEEVVSRLGRRRQCLVCGTITAAEGTCPAKELFCLKDGSKLIQRSDDQPSAIRERLRVYRGHSRELVHYYKERDYHRIAANRSAGEIASELLRIVNLRIPADVLALQGLARSA